jgi:hypothetical protein
MGALRNGLAPDAEFGKDKIIKKRIQINRVLINMKFEACWIYDSKYFLEHLLGPEKSLNKRYPKETHL